MIAGERRKAGLGTGCLVAACLLLVSGCGGRLSQAEFVNRANQICVESKREIGEVRRPPAQAPAPASVAYVDRLIGVSRREFERLGKLRPPEQFDSDWEAFLESGERAQRLLEQLKAATQARDAVRGQSVVTGLSRLASQASRQAQVLSLSQCG